MPQIRPSIVALLIGASALGFAACDGTDDSTAAQLGIETSALETVDRQGILNEVDEVRTILRESGSAVSLDSISDVEFRDRTLRVTATERLSGVAEAESLCRDMHAALEMSDVTVEVVDVSGALVASCGS